ncbi:unnamed protein product [Chilo suppressalis]|uniref:MADF domain-containing protein n=1 Tax=Chilo suppressalis TaxID=168631 RepID=A0ABN8L903_CHISP|nr:unnamed protein product [Chilo suppressalis]
MLTEKIHHSIRAAKDITRIPKQYLHWKTVTGKQNENYLNTGVRLLEFSKVAKAEWKKLRDSHRDSLKRSRSKSEQGAEAINNWKYAKLMRFLLPYMKNRKRSIYTAMSVTENSETVHSPSSEPQMQDSDNSNQSWQLTENQNIGPNDLSSNNTNASKSRKLDKIDIIEMMREIVEHHNSPCEERHQRKKPETQKTTRDKHPLDSFFDSMCTTTKQFPSWLQISVKRKIFTIVSEAEDTFENLNYDSSSWNYNDNTNTTAGTASTIPCETESKPIIQDNQCIPPQQSPQ